MKMINRTLLIFVLLIVEGYPQIQRYNGATLTGNNNWRGTIVIAGDVILESNSRLFIEPGTKILFEANRDLNKSGIDKTRSELIIRGTLIARGLPGKKITFTSKSAYPRMGEWYGIEFLHLKSGSILEYCVIEYAYNGLTIKNSRLQINNNDIRYNYHAGIRTEVKASPEIINNIISENGYAGLICELGARPVLTDNLISLNRIGVVVFSLSQPNLGSLSPGDNYNPGRNNIFNNEEYNFYNHSNKPILAENNSWGDDNLSAIALKLYDQKDNSKYGSVDYLPLQKVSGQPGVGNKFLLAQNSNQGSDTTRENSVENSSDDLFAGNPENNVITSDTVKANDTGQDPAREGRLDMNNKMAEISPLIASTSSSNPIPSDLPVSSASVTKQIDYDQIFLELFLDSGKKKYMNKPRLRVTNVLRNVLQPGEVRIRVVVNQSGTVQSASVLRGINEILDEAVLATVKSYKYHTGTINGQPVKFTTSEVFRFE